MENEIKQIIQEARNLRDNGRSDKKIAEFVHIELGKLIVYDSNYRFGFEEYDISKNSEEQKSMASKIRQEKILSKKSSIKSRKQICKGMAEIYTAILVELGIDAKVVAVQSTEEVEGEIREDGSVIDVPGIYRTSFNTDFEIKMGENEKNNNSNIGHYYSIIKLDEGEFIQDFVTEKALVMIKIDEIQTNENIPGFHRKEEHRERSNKQNDKISETYVEKIREELFEYIQGKDDSNAFDFIFEKLKEYIKEFGYEEAKDFVVMYAKEIIPKEMISEVPIPITLIKEDEENCEVLCIYRYGEKNYLLRGGQSTIDLPIGEVSNDEIQKNILQEFKPRKPNDEKKIRSLQIEKKENEIISIESTVRNAISQGTSKEAVDQMDKAEQSIRSSIGNYTSEIN